VQDRIIPWTERLRCQRLLPADLQPRIAEFTAGNWSPCDLQATAELPALARKVLDEKLYRAQSNQEVGKELEAGLPAP